MNSSGFRGFLGSALSQLQPLPTPCTISFELAPGFEGSSLFAESIPDAEQPLPLSQCIVGRNGRRTSAQTGNILQYKREVPCAVSFSSRLRSQTQKNSRRLWRSRRRFRENPGAFPKAGPIFQLPFSFPENAQTLAGIAFRAAGKSVENFPAASKIC